MAQYHFLTTWDLAAPVETVWEVIRATPRYPTWWKYVAEVTEIEPTNPDGTGGLYLYKWKTALPYTLAFEMRVTRYQPPNLVEASARGELDGIGRWELQSLDGFTRVTYDWQVRTKKAWMNLLAPLARLVFSWNHNTIMDEGGRALAAHLGVRLLTSKNVSLR